MQGALVGATPEQAFYVICDESNNPASSVDEGKLIVEIGIAPVKPAEFVIFRISQWQGGGATSE
jgi:phage tail sheath protein FI